MLKITEETTNENMTLLRLEGRLVEEWVALLRVSGAGRDVASFVLDLSGLRYANQNGIELLLDWQARGATLRDASLFLHEMLRQATPACHIEQPPLAVH